MSTGPVTSVFRWDGLAVTLQAPSSALAARVAEYLALPWSPAGAVDPPDILVDADGWIRWSGGSDACRFEDDDDRVMSVVALVSTLFRERTPSVVLHAGAFVADGQAVLFCGQEFAGKSTLACTAWQQGLGLMGDDWIVLEPDHAHARPFPKPLKIRDLAAPPCGPVPLRGRLMSGEPRLMFGRTLPGMIGYDARIPVGALFLLSPADGGPTRVTPAARDTALLQVLEQTMETKASRLGGVRMLERLIRREAVFAITIAERDHVNALALMQATSRLARNGGRR